MAQCVTKSQKFALSYRVFVRVCRLRVMHSYGRVLGQENSGPGRSGVHQRHVPRELPAASGE